MSVKRKSDLHPCQLGYCSNLYKQLLWEVNMGHLSGNQSLELRNYYSFYSYFKSQSTQVFSPYCIVFSFLYIYSEMILKANDLQHHYIYLFVFLFCFFDKALALSIASSFLPQVWSGPSVLLWGKRCLQAGDLWRGQLVEKCPEETAEDHRLCPLPIPWMWSILWLLGHRAILQADHHHRWGQKSSISY